MSQLLGTKVTLMRNRANFRQTKNLTWHFHHTGPFNNFRRVKVVSHERNLYTYNFRPVQNSAAGAVSVNIG